MCGNEAGIDTGISWESDWVFPGPAPALLAPDLEAVGRLRDVDSTLSTAES
jgi:hypothetical protein